MPSVEKKVVFWPARLKDELNALKPDDARIAIYQALNDIKRGVKPPKAKPHGEDDRLKGLMKIANPASDGNTYRTVYTVEYEEAVWVIDLYPKKSVEASETPKVDKDRALKRYKALRDYRSTREGREFVAALLDDLRKREADAVRQRSKFDVTRKRKPKGS